MDLLQKAFENAKHQDYKKNYRVYQRIRAITTMEKPYFITLTYDEAHIKKADNKNAKEWCKEYLTHYYGNDDYGKLNERYHHHIFGNFIQDIDLNKSWKYGSVNVIKWKGGDKAIAKYIMRIKNHAHKSNTNNIIKSKNTGINKKSEW